MSGQEGVGMLERDHFGSMVEALESSSRIARKPLDGYSKYRSTQDSIDDGALVHTLQSSILRLLIRNRAWSALTSVAPSASAWAAIIKSSGAMVTPLASSAARSVP